MRLRRRCGLSRGPCCLEFPMCLSDCALRGLWEAFPSLLRDARGSLGPAVRFGELAITVTVILIPPPNAILFIVYPISNLLRSEVTGP